MRNMGRRFSILVSFLAVLLPATAAHAVEIHPFYARHFSPLVQAFGLPPAEDGDTAPAGTVLSRLVVDAANSYHSGTGPRQSASLDGETWRTTLALRYGVGGFVLGTDDPATIARFAAEVAPATRQLVAAGRRSTVAA